MLLFYSVGDNCGCNGPAECQGGLKCGIKNCAGLYFPEDANCCTNECGESEACINDDDGRCDCDDDNVSGADDYLQKNRRVD